jgi:hypothetical protein
VCSSPQYPEGAPKKYDPSLPPPPSPQLHRYMYIFRKAFPLANQFGVESSLFLTCTDKKEKKIFSHIRKFREIGCKVKYD